MSWFKRFDSLKLRLVFTYLVIIIVSVTIFRVYILNVLDSYLYNQNRVNLMTEINILSIDISAYTPETLTQSVDEALVQLGIGKDTRVIVTDIEAKVIYDSTVNVYANSVGKTRLSKMVIDALSGQNVYQKLTDQNGNVTTAAAVPIVYNNQTRGAVFMEVPTGELENVLGDLNRNMTVLTVLLCIVIGLISFVFASIITAPIENLIKKIKGITKYDKTQKIDIDASGEIGELVNTFNDMADELQSQEEKRTEFVSNASHELKTPLSSIKLICDSLLEAGTEQPELTKEFLNDMNNEVERLTRIINDLLDLTKMDAMNDDMQSTFVTGNLRDVVGGVVKALRNIAQKNGVTLTFDTNNDVFMLMNENKIWEAIYNIVDNAIKYTPEGGLVEVYLEKDSKEAIVTVRDNGIGIAADDLKNIFDRFYRVDKARSRETGGTGLGLSIALSAVSLHGGHIEVQSEEAGGSVFRIFLPVA